MIITNTQYMERHEAQSPQYTIVAQSFETRTGWGHIVKVKDKNFDTIGYAKINYLNRTWEKYRYQSAILQAISNAKSDRLDTLKTLNNIKRLTQQRKQKLATADTIYNELEQLYNIYKY